MLSINDGWVQLLLAKLNPASGDRELKHDLKFISAFVPDQVHTASNGIVSITSRAIEPKCQRKYRTLIFVLPEFVNCDYGR